MHLFDRRKVGLFEHLAAEEFLLDGGGDRCPALMFWRGPGAVVLGKNQNPWRECNLTVIQERGLLIARRVSGGGTVYHDPGNLNFSWVVDRAGYRPDMLHGILRDALAGFGLKSETAPTGGLLIEGYKVSGAAYCYRQDRVLHHGTLLWNADLPMMLAALAAPRIRLKTHAVNSVPARVKNLSDLLPDRNVEDVMDAVIREAEKRFGRRIHAELSEDSVEERVNLLRSRLRSWEWIWGQTPRFEVSIMVEGTPVGLVIRKGRVDTIRFGERDVAASVPYAFGPELPVCLAGEWGLETVKVAEAFRDAGWVWWHDGCFE